MKGAIIFNFGRPWAGREKLAFEAFGDSLVFFGKLAADDKCEEPLVYMGPSGGGMIIIHGERDMLFEITLTEEFRKMYLKAGYCVPDLTYELFFFGDAAHESMGLWAGVGAELGLM